MMSLLRHYCVAVWKRMRRFRNLPPLVASATHARHDTINIAHDLVNLAKSLVEMDVSSALQAGGAMLFALLCAFCSARGVIQQGREIRDHLKEAKKE